MSTILVRCVAVVALTAAQLVAVVGIAATTAAPAGATTIPAGYFRVLDQQGSNDVPAQSDLTQMGRDTSTAGVFKLFWSWDSTDQWAGSGQTGDACSLFDYNGNGNIDAAVCAQINNPSANVVNQTTGGGSTANPNSPFVFRCDDAKNDRCSNPTNPLSYVVNTDIKSGDLASFAASPPANLITDTDPFGPTNVTAEILAEPAATTRTTRRSRSRS